MHSRQAASVRVSLPLWPNAERQVAAAVQSVTPATGLVAAAVFPVGLFHATPRKENFIDLTRQSSKRRSSCFSAPSKRETQTMIKNSILSGPPMSLSKQELLQVAEELSECTSAVYPLVNA